MSRHAVCYTATAGYLFQTVVSALQARSFLASNIDVVVCFIGPECDEQRQFQAICEQNHISLLTAPVAALDGLHPSYARLFLDELLPAEIDEVLYLDGDTQIVADISPLVLAEPPAGGALAVRDPMVFTRAVHVGLGRKVDERWDRSKIPLAARPTYINSGVLRMARDDLRLLRKEVLTNLRGTLDSLHYGDQDAINLALQHRIETISMSWNFPGFLLDTQFVELTPPRIIHFMSNPRPWNATLRPWGQEHHDPYQQFVRDYPQIERYWQRFSRLQRVEYRLQQQYKHWTERRAWQTAEAAALVRDLEQATRSLN
jgi:lipopolysaccharide biosynthesis glycosyltransferase